MISLDQITPSFKQIDTITKVPRLSAGPQENQKALQAIIVQIAKLQGQSKLEGEGDKFLINSKHRSYSG